MTSLSTAISSSLSIEIINRYSTDMSLSAAITNTGAVVYKGTWDARTVGEGGTGTPPISGQGFYYIVNISGSTPLTGVTGVISEWGVGDWAVNDGTYWDKIDNTEAPMEASLVSYSIPILPLVSNVQQALDSGITYATTLTPLSMTVVSGGLGGISASTTVGDLKGKTFTELFDTLLFPTVMATSTSPNLTLGGFPSGYVDVGSQYTPSVTTTFGQGTITNGNGTPGPSLVGSAYLYTFRLPGGATDGVPSITSTHTYVTPMTIPLETSYQWSVLVNYSGGTGLYYDNKGGIDTHLNPLRVSSSITTSSVAIIGLNRRYWGTSPDPSLTNVTGFTSSELTLNRTKTFDIDFNGQYLYYCYPSRFGLATFTVGGFGVGFVLSTFSVTNNATVPYTETFNVYRSPSTQAPGMKHIVIT